MMALSAALADAPIAESVLDLPFPPTVSDDTLAAPLTAEGGIGSLLQSAGEFCAR